MVSLKRACGLMATLFALAGSIAERATSAADPDNQQGRGLTNTPGPAEIGGLVFITFTSSSSCSPRHRNRFALTV